MRFTFPLLMMVVCGLSGCASTAPKTVQATTGEKVSIGYRGKIHERDGWFVQVTEKDRKWMILGITTKPERRWTEDAEIIWVQRDLKVVEPAFQNNKGYKASVNEIECSPLLSKNIEYGACNSRLTKIDVGRSVGKNVLAAAMTFGLASGTNRGIDHDLILAIMKDTELLDTLAKPEYGNALAYEDTKRSTIEYLLNATLRDRAIALNAGIKAPEPIAESLALTMTRAAIAAMTLKQGGDYRTPKGTFQRFGNFAYTDIANSVKLDGGCARVEGHITVHDFIRGSFNLIPTETRSVGAVYCTLDGKPWSETNKAMCMQMDGKRICDDPFAISH